jgi:hypothetical protein
LSAEVSLQLQSDPPSYLRLRLTRSLLLMMRTDLPTRTSILKAFRCLKAKRKLRERNSTGPSQFSISTQFHSAIRRTRSQTKKNRLKRAKRLITQKIKRLSARMCRILSERLLKGHRKKAVEAQAIPQKAHRELRKNWRRSFKMDS